MCGLRDGTGPCHTGGGQGDGRSIQIDPASRRVANIRTAAVQSIPQTRPIRAVGQLRYDEGALATISSYVDGRIERLYADFTGMDVRRMTNWPWSTLPRCTVLRSSCFSRNAP
jgi:hypothetical protein